MENAWPDECVFWIACRETERFPELMLVSIANLNPTGLLLAHRGQWLFPKDLSASSLLLIHLFIHSSFLISWWETIF